VWLAATGYALYYFSSDENAAWLPLLHWVVGLAVPFALIVHILAGRQRPPRAHPHPKKQPALRVVASAHSPASQKASS